MRPIIIHTPVWGANLPLLKSALGRSLKWPKNNKTISDATWIILSDGNDNYTIESIASEVLPGSRIEIISRPDLTEIPDCRGPVMLDVVQRIAERCINTGSSMLMACPDFIFGDGTLRNLQIVGQQKDVCVSFPHLRVLPSVLDRLDLSEQYGDKDGRSNARLMYLGLCSAHKAWTTADIENTGEGCFKGGVSWRKVANHTYLLQHLLPSPFFVNFKMEDILFFQSVFARGFGAWDHKWPSLLLEQQRLRVICSSDAAAMIEITDEDKNVPPHCEFSPEDPDAFFLDEPHFRIQKQFMSIFRGEL